MAKPLRYAVSFTVYRNNNKEFLVVKRPKDSNDELNSGIWGLPATNFDTKKEAPDEAVVRGGIEKLGCKIEPVRRLPISMVQEREDYDLLMIDYECRLVSGEPDVNTAHTSGTKYVEQMWVKDPKILYDAAKKGSACVQLFLFDKGLLKRENFITKL